MKFYYIWVKIFSFEFKKKKNRNMSPKNGVKMINIQKFYSTSVLFGLFCPLRSILVLFGLRFSYWVQPVQIDPILFTLVLFGPCCSYSVHFGFIRSTLVLFVPLCPLWSTMILFGPIWYYSILFVPIRSICPF